MRFMMSVSHDLVALYRAHIFLLMSLLLLREF